MGLCFQLFTNNDLRNFAKTAVISAENMKKPCNMDEVLVSQFQGKKCTTFTGETSTFTAKPKIYGMNYFVW